MASFAGLLFAGPFLIALYGFIHVQQHLKWLDTPEHRHLMGDAWVAGHVSTARWFFGGVMLLCLALGGLLVAYALR